MTIKSFGQSARYRKFSAATDRASEGFLFKTRAKISDDLRQFMAMVQIEVQRVYPTLNREFPDPYTQYQIKALDESIARHAYTAAITMAQHWITLRYYTFMLRNAAEQQAIINAQGGAPKKISLERAKEEAYKTTEFGNVFDRCLLSLSRLRRDIVDAVEMARILGEEVPQALSRVLNVFPVEQEIKVPKTLRRITEAAKKEKEAEFSFKNFLTEDEWLEIVEEYKSTFIPKWRDPRSGKLSHAVKIEGEEGYAVYAWQLEKEMTEDFVSKVTNGQHEGAKAQGITDFVWIAILDDRTDDCCVKRDGLTVSEIKDKLSGAWSNDKCRAHVPPAHFNCRCRLAPATEHLPEMPESNEEEFLQWVTSESET